MEIDKERCYGFDKLFSTSSRPKIGTGERENGEVV
tara:strand:- start:618 stop:722 length:105 start_codon:yes stop_codon:yes gene_type:complete